MVCRKLPISAILSKSEDWVQPNPERVYQQIRVRLWGKGLTLRARVLGSSIAARRQIRAKSGHFLVSRIDARHGAFGIVPDHLDGALVSNDFPCFEIDKNAVLPDYLEAYTRTDQFIDLCRRASEGSTNRVRLKENKLMAMEIPVPSFDQQRKIIGRLDRVASLVEEGATLKQGAHEDRLSLLANMAHRPDMPESTKEHSGWSKIQLHQVLSPAAEAHPVSIDAVFPNIGIYSFARGPFVKPSIDGSSTSAKTLYRVRKGQFIYSRLFAFEGAYTIVPAEMDGHFVSGEFPSFDIAADAATPEFLAAYFMESRVWAELASESVGLGSRRQRVNQRRLLERCIWLPPLSWQKKLSVVYRSTLRCNSEAEGADHDSLMRACLHEVFQEETGY